jgi:hypothetical protein
MNEENLNHLKLTDREFACLLWNTIYPERKPFKDITEDAKKEWERWSKIARDIADMDGTSRVSEIKEILKPQL